MGQYGTSMWNSEEAWQSDIESLEDEVLNLRDSLSIRKYLRYAGIGTAILVFVLPIAAAVLFALGFRVVDQAFLALALVSFVATPPLLVASLTKWEGFPSYARLRNSLRDAERKLARRRAAFDAWQVEQFQSKQAA